MKHLTLLLLISVVLLSGCSSDESAQLVNNIVTDAPENAIISTPTSEPTSPPVPDPTPTLAPTKAPKVSKLFTSVYLPYANREKSWYFQSVKSFAKSCGYSCKVTKPTEDDLGQIKISDSNGDYVYFSFMPSTTDDEILMCVSFYQKKSNSEVSLSNYSTDSSASYDTFDIHVVGEQNEKVSSTDEQQEFLFH